MNQTETAGHFLDLASWNRRQHFDLFRGFENPFFSVCMDVDATAAWETCRGPSSPSFYVAILFRSLCAANETEAFRRRMRGNQVWVHDSVRASATILRDDGTFGFAILPLAQSFDDFHRQALGEILEVKAPRPLEIPRAGEDDLIYHSILPWIRFTSFTNALNGGKDSIPRIVFGKCTQDGSRWMLPVAVQVHHALVDGLDVARFLERFQHGLSDFAEMNSR